MSSFIPKKNSTYDLGSDKYYWKDLYVTDIIRIKEPVKYYTPYKRTSKILYTMSATPRLKPGA